MVRKISKVKTPCGDTMWKSLNWVVISSEKEPEVSTRRFDQYLYFFYKKLSAGKFDIAISDSLRWNLFKGIIYQDDWYLY